MKLYHLTAIPPTGATIMAHGSFTAPRQQELVTGCSSSLELYSLRSREGRLDPVMRTDAFAQIRGLDVFRLPGTRRDYVVVTSDSGSISILSADATTGTFNRVHCEPFGKSGCRRIIPGQFLACEPRGRACMVGAVEKQKFAYVLNRDPEENLTISSPLEAHKSNYVTFALTSLDVGFENPMFAALEKGYEKDANKLLVYYELDLGLNHVVRKLVSPVHSSSSLILSVPGHSDGPGGVLVCSFGYVSYRSLLDEDDKGGLLSLTGEAKANGPEEGSGQPDGFDVPTQIEAKLPFREGTDPETTMIVSGTVYQDKKGSAFFFLLCTEFGDLIKAELTWDAQKGASALRLVFFDTLPAPAYAMCIFRSGYVAVAMEGSDMLLLKFRQVDVPDDEAACGVSESKPTTPSASDEKDMMEDGQTPNGTDGHMNGEVGTSPSQLTFAKSRNGRSRLVFKRRKRLAYLSVASVIESLAPVTSICSDPARDGQSAALVCASGRWGSGGIRVVRQGMAVMELSSPHQLPSRVTSVLTLRDRAESRFDRFIVVSFEDRTKVLEVGETKVEENVSSGFELSQATLCASQMSLDSLLQVHRYGVRYIPSGRVEDAQEWKPPVPTQIVAGCCNHQQVIVALSSGALVYFEVDEESNSLREMEKLSDVLVPTGGGQTVTKGAGDVGAEPSLSIPDIPPGRKRASFFVVGDGSNNKVRLFRIGRDGTIEALGLHVAPAPVQSLSLVDFGLIDRDVIDSSRGAKKKSRGNEAIYQPLLTLLIGTRQGALVRLSIDAVTGTMADRRGVFLGPSGVQVEDIRVTGVPACLAMGSKPWIFFPQSGHIAMTPLCTERLDHAASFSTEQSPDGFVTASGSKLRLLSIDLINSIINSALLPHGLPSVAIPSATLVGCSYNLSRTRMNGTPRRVFRLAQNHQLSRGDSKVGHTQSASASEAQGELFVIVETDHRRTWAERAGGSTASPPKQGYEDSSQGSRDASTSPSEIGSWFSRVQLVKLANGDAESDDEDEYDGSDPFADISLSAVTVLDSIAIPKANTCVLASTSSHSLGLANGDPDTLSYVVVSYATNLVVSATSPEAASERRKMEEDGYSASYALSVYRVDRRSLKFEFLHETKTLEPVHALVPFRDMLLVGTGPTIRLYDLGKRQLLRKGEYKFAVKNKVSSLAVAGGDRVFVGDVQESVTMFKFILPGTLMLRKGKSGALDREGGRFVPIASDVLPRWVVALEVLDYSTVCGGDKFGNIFVLRLPSEIAGDTDEFAGVTAAERSFSPGSRSAPHKLSVEACIHVGSTVTSLHQGQLSTNTFQAQIGAGAADSIILYSTVNGTVGILAPLQLRGDADFTRALEREMRKRFKSVCGRDHTAYRSAFYPVKNVFDGDLCEMFNGLPHAAQESCAGAISRSREDIAKKLEELRATFL